MKWSIYLCIRDKKDKAYIYNQLVGESDSEEGAYTIAGQIFNTYLPYKGLGTDLPNPWWIQVEDFIVRARIGYFEQVRER